MEAKGYVLQDLRTKFYFSSLYSDELFYRSFSDARIFFSFFFARNCKT